MPLPNFIKIHCANNDIPNCGTCPRELIIPVDAIEGVFRDENDHAVILIKGIHYLPSLKCVNRLRFICTTATWDEIINMLDGHIQDIGTVMLTDQDNVPKG